MRIIAIVLLCCLIQNLAYGQMSKGRITLSLLSDQQTALEGATAELLRTKDSALVRSAVADKNGIVEMDNVPYGHYLVRATAVGRNRQFSVPFALEGPSFEVPALKLSPRAGGDMESVTVSARKPFIQKLNDRLIVNVESSILSAGSTALDILERSPGVTLDQNDAISLRGRAGVIIMIDGKPSPMTGSDLANYLRGLPSGAIDRIEIITNPSAKYDAAGNSGIIDIRLKKDQRLGTNGTLTTGYGQGIYPKWNAGGTINYRNKSVNIFGNYNYNYRKLLNDLSINREFYENGVFKGEDFKENKAVMPLRGQNARIGADFFPSKNTIIGFVLNGSTTSIDRRADINTLVNDKDFNPDFRFLSISTNDDNFDNLVGNINFKQKLGTKGAELTADVDYGRFNSRSITRTSSFFYNLDETKRKDDDILDGDQTGKLILRTGKVDYSLPLAGGAKLEAGAKTSYVSSDNDAKFFNVLGAGPVVDQGKTNRFFYGEYNNAGYVNFSKEYKKFNFQLGLRGEHTDVNTRQVKGDTRFHNDYFQLFPSAFFNYKLKEDKTIGASVSRRIDRPGYSQLNPFLFQVDATIYSTGEPRLLPQTTWSYELSYTLKSHSFTLGYSRTHNPQNSVLVKILDVIPNFEIKAGQDSNITVQIPVNLESQDYFGLTATLPFRPAKWWNMINNVNVFYSHFNGNLGGSRLNDGTPAANIRTNNTFTFKKGWSAELNANLNTGGRNGYMLLDPMWSLSLGGQKNVMEGKGTFRLSVTDIFWTSLPRATVTYPGSYIEHFRVKRETRVATLSFTYRFGSNKVQAARKRATASEEERQRAGQ